MTANENKTIISKIVNVFRLTLVGFMLSTFR